MRTTTPSTDSDALTKTSFTPDDDNWMQGEEHNYWMGQPYKWSEIAGTFLANKRFNLRGLAESAHRDVHLFWACHAGAQIAKNYSPTTTDRLPDVEREKIKTEVYDLLKEAGTDNWDGEGALGLDARTVTVAQQLVDKLPSYIPKPDVTATPHGEVDFDWVIDSDLMLTVSVGPSNEIAFAGLFHGARLNGREPWMGMLPQFVHCCLERLHDSQDG